MKSESRFSQFETRELERMEAAFCKCGLRIFAEEIYLELKSRKNEDDDKKKTP